MYRRASHILAQAVAGFDWDEGNLTKCQQHGVPVAEIERLFTRPHRISADVEHSLAEERLKAIGKSSSGRPIFLVFTLRERDGSTYIRPISARYMHRREVESYEEENPGFSN
jgi:uncharacterized DUF497 family protein